MIFKSVKRWKRRKIDEYELAVFKRLISLCLESMRSLQKSLNDFDKDKCDTEAATEATLCLRLICAYMTDLTSNRFLPVSSELRLRSITPKFIKLFEDAIIGFINVSTVVEKYHGDIRPLLQDDISLRKAYCDYFINLAGLRNVLSIMMSIIIYEQNKIDANFNYISNYYNNLNIINCKLPPVIEYKVVFSIQQQTENNKKENVKNDK